MLSIGRITHLVKFSRIRRCGLFNDFTGSGGDMSYLKLHKALIAMLFLVTGCSSMEEVNYVSSGIGTEVYKGNSQSQYDINKTYFGYLCATAAIPHDWGGGDTPSCHYGGFQTSD